MADIPPSKRVTVMVLLRKLINILAPPAYQPAPVPIRSRGRRRKIAIILFLVLLTALTVGCGAQPQAETTSTKPVTITVFAAASLTEAFTEIGHNFEAAQPDVKVIFNFAGSQQLAHQLSQGAPADVFASANTAQMQTAIEAGRVTDNAAQTFVHNRLVVIYPADNPAGLVTLQDLSKPGLRLILAAADVPVGRYSQQFLDKAAQDPAFEADFKDGLLTNVVSYEQSVKAVLTKVALGEGDAGIVYNSDVTADIADQVSRIDIPDDLNTIATYPIAVVSDTESPNPSQNFVAYVLSPAGQDVLAKFGFTGVP